MDYNIEVYFPIVPDLNGGRYPFEQREIEAFLPSL